MFPLPNSLLGRSPALHISRPAVSNKVGRRHLSKQDSHSHYTSRPFAYIEWRTILKHYRLTATSGLYHQKTRAAILQKYQAVVMNAIEVRIKKVACLHFQEARQGYLLDDVRLLMETQNDTPSYYSHLCKSYRA